MEFDVDKFVGPKNEIHSVDVEEVPMFAFMRESAGKQVLIENEIYTHISDNVFAKGDKFSYVFTEEKDYITYNNPFISVITRFITNQEYWMEVFTMVLRSSAVAKDNMATRKAKQVNYVYLMRDTITGFTKIGYSKDPKFRETTLQSQKPAIKMIFNIIGGRNKETFLHRKYKEKRKRGEWFDLTKSDIEDIKNYLTT